MVFSGLYPVDSEDYEDLKVALEKLELNDSSFNYEPETSAALGFGFRCGFLGLLHLDVVQERLRREYGLSLILSAPSVRYHVMLENGEAISVDNPSYYPDPSTIASATEPCIKGSVMIPERFIGTVMELCRERRGENIQFNYLAQGRVELTEAVSPGKNVGAVGEDIRAGALVLEAGRRLFAERRP